MRIILTGHSLCHSRQLYFAKELAELNNEILVLAPQKWNHITLEHKKEDNFEIIPLEATTNNMHNFELVNFHQELNKFNPDVVYLLEEYYTRFAYQVYEKTNKSIKLGFHSYENIKDIDSRDEITLFESDFLIAGNRGAYDILNKIKKPDLILPLTGINTELFRPIDLDKWYSIIYHGRDVPEKGVKYINDIPNISKIFMYLPSTDYEDVVFDINHCKISIQYPYSTPTWKEQFNCAIAESLACNIPVIASDEDAILEYYSDCDDCFIIPSRNQDILNKTVADLLENYEHHKFNGRDFILEKLSNRVIAKKLNNLFKEIVK